MLEADILEHAADLIDTYGHLKGRTGNRDIGFCLVGAIHAAVCDYERHDQRTPSRVPLIYLVANHVGFDRLAITRWNDASERTHGEVTDALRHTAKDIRNKETQ